MASINKETILRKLHAPNKRLDVLVRHSVENQVKNQKEELIEKLENHPISQELAGNGSEMGNINGRSGNLRTLIGFYPTDKPVETLKNLLLTTIFLRNVPPRRHQNGPIVNYRFSLSIPSLNYLYERTPYPDEHSSGSWLRGIHKGVPNLRYYLFSTNDKIRKSFKKSRSTYAIQTKRIVRSSPSKMSGVKYVDQLLEDFKQSFNK